MKLEHVMSRHGCLEPSWKTERVLFYSFSIHIYTHRLLSCLDVEGTVRVGVDPVVGNGTIVARGRLGAVRVKEHCRATGIAQVDWLRYSTWSITTWFRHDIWWQFCSQIGHGIYRSGLNKGQVPAWPRDTSNQLPISFNASVWGFLGDLM